MKYGICNLNVIPLRSEANSLANQQSQLLYGELFKILEQRKFFSKIRCLFDDYQGWISNLHFKELSQEQFYELKYLKPSYNYDLAHYVHNENNSLLPVVIGSDLSKAPFLNHQCEASIIPNQHSVVSSAMMYLNATELVGGKTPFGIDSSGLTQMAYKLNGMSLKRTPQEQSTQGEALSFIEEAKAGDLVFFDNKDGVIDHVGILLENNYIIHAFGTVRIDRIDHTGIFNIDTNTYTHSVRVIKSFL